MDARSLVEVRQNCALEQLPAILAKVMRDNPAEHLPATKVYCMRAIKASAHKGLLAGLYDNLALQAQGRSAFVSASDANLLVHDESGKTAGSILRAAQSGATSYTSINGAVQKITCELAFDAGFTWAFRNPQKPQPYAMTASQAEDMAEACFEKHSATIGASALPATKAGLIAGAWFGKMAHTQQ